MLFLLKKVWLYFFKRGSILSWFLIILSKISCRDIWQNLFLEIYLHLFASIQLSPNYPRSHKVQSRILWDGHIEHMWLDNHAILEVSKFCWGNTVFGWLTNQLHQIAWNLIEFNKSDKKENTHKIKKKYTIYQAANR